MPADGNNETGQNGEPWQDVVELGLKKLVTEHQQRNEIPARTTDEKLADCVEDLSLLTRLGAALPVEIQNSDDLTAIFGNGIPARYLDPLAYTRGPEDYLVLTGETQVSKFATIYEDKPTGAGLQLRHHKGRRVATIAVKPNPINKDQRTIEIDKDLFGTPNKFNEILSSAVGEVQGALSYLVKHNSS